MKVYRTIEGDRWDWIAYKLYGSPFFVRQLIEANPHIPCIPILPANLEVKAPNIEIKKVKEILPPWKR